MPNKPKSAKRAQPGGNEVKRHIAALKKHEAALKKNAAALDRHTAALDAHTSAMERASGGAAALTDAMSRTRLAFAAALAKGPDEKTADAGDCVADWLVKKKRVSRTDAGDPSKNMTNDFLMNPDDMGICLNWVKGCLAKKGDHFTPDTSYEHLVSLTSGTLGAVIADIVSKIKP